MGQGLVSKWGRDGCGRRMSPLLTPVSPQAQPTDMRALQDFEEADKLHIQMNDIITVIEGRYCMGTHAPAASFSAASLCGDRGPQEQRHRGHWQSCGEQGWGALPAPAHLATCPSSPGRCATPPGSTEPWDHPSAGAQPCLRAAQPCPHCPHHPPPLTHPTAPVGLPQPCPGKPHTPAPLPADSDGDVSLSPSWERHQGTGTVVA